LKETKLSLADFQSFLIKDYVIFKTEVLTKAKMSGIVWGAVMGGIVSFVLMLIAHVLKI
jgi:predicted HAD superfamily hydrolase